MWPLLAPILGSLVERIFPDKDKQNEVKLELAKVAAAAEVEQAKTEAVTNQSKASVIVAEAQSEGWAARNWRPHLMYAIMVMMLYNWMVAGILRSIGLDITIIPIPNDMWTLLQIGVGGYIVGKSGENMMSTYATNKFNDQRFYEVYKEEMGISSLDQATVDRINKALNSARNK